MYGDRIPGFYVSNTNGASMPRGREEHFYTEKEKYKHLLASHDRRLQRHLERKKRRHHHHHNPEPEPEIVKSGSDEEDQSRPVRKYHRRRNARKRDQDLLDTIERRERILLKQMERKHFLSQNDVKEPMESSERSQHDSGLQVQPFGKTFRVGKRYGDSSRLTIPEEGRGDYVGNENTGDYSRHQRASIMNRAERLIDVRKQKLREINQSFHNGTSPGIQRQKGFYRENYVRRPEDTDSGDDTPYVFVKTTLTPEPMTPPIDVLSNAGYTPLPVIKGHHAYPDLDSALSFPMGTRSEIQGIYSDEDNDPLPTNRPYTDTYKGHPNTIGGPGRFQDINSKAKAAPAGSFRGVPPQSVARRGTKHGKLVTFFINGNSNFKGLTVSVKRESFTTMLKLQEHLDRKLNLAYPIKHIFSLPDGIEVKNLDEFEPNRSYIVCKDKNVRINGVKYGYSKEKHWVTKPPSAGKVRKSEIGQLFTSEPPANSPIKNRRVITIIQNKKRSRREKVILNPDTHLAFEQLLSDMGDMINMNATGLFLYKKPEIKVTSYSQLFREFRNVDEFIICGPELVPIAEESVSKQGPNSLGSSTDSITGLVNGDDNMYAAASPLVDDVRWEESQEDAYVNGLMTEDEEDTFRKIRIKIKGKYREYYEPSYIGNEDPSKPRQKLILEWIYGYRPSGNGSSLLYYPKTGELVCYMDSVVIFYSPTFDAQRHYLSHTEHITSMAIHPEGRWVATGQMAGMEPENAAHIRVWDGKTLSTQSVLGIGIFSKGIVAVNFSESGQLLCAIDGSDKHVLSLWNWSKKRLLAKTTTTDREVVNACFYPFDETILISYGQQHMFFWKDSEGRLLRDRESGGLPGVNRNRCIQSIAFTDDGDVITGDSTGSIIVWTVQKPTYIFRYNMALFEQLEKVHSSPVISLCMMSSNVLLSGGGNQVKAWDILDNFRNTRERALVESIGDVSAIIPKSLDENGKQVFFFGTTKSCILEGSLDAQPRKHIEAHYDAVWALVAHPKEKSFFTASYDETVRKWSAESHRLLWTTSVNRSCTSIDIDDRGKILAMGTVDGHVVLLSATKKEEITKIKVGSGADSVETVKFSPSDRDMLAAGCSDGSVYIYNGVKHGGNIQIRHKKILKTNVDTGSILKIDWSTSCHFIQTMSSEMDVFYWDVTDMRPAKPGQYRDVEWATVTCAVGYNVAGPWSNMKSGESITSVNKAGSLLAVGDSKGRIRLYQYPCAVNQPEYNASRVYKSDVTALSFLAREGVSPIPDRLISCGTQKGILAQWTVEGVHQFPPDVNDPGWNQTA